MKRREFITLIGGAAAWPLAARAQQPERVRRIGVMIGDSETGLFGSAIAAFQREMQGRRHGQAERLGRLEIDDCLELRWMLHGQVGGFGLGLLHELLPNAAVVALMVNPNNLEFSTTLANAQEAARTLGWQLLGSAANAARPCSISVLPCTY